MNNSAHAFIILILVFSLAECSNSTGKKDEHKPNLVVVFSDQHSYDMLGSSGNEQIITPNLDRFAKQGVRFTSSYSNSPVCTPFRSMLLSGMHPLHNGAWFNDKMMIPGEGKYIAKVLSDAGYTTAYIGKWHLLGGKRDRPIPKGKMRYGFNDIFWTDNVTTEFRAGKAFYWNNDGEKVRYQQWQPYGQTDQAIDFINGVDSENPFALFLSWHPPHDWGKTPKGYYRYDTLKELEKMYEGVKPELRPTVTDTSIERKDQLLDYMAMVSGVDKAFGELMDALEAKGVSDNTLVVFTADHGDMLGSHGWKVPKRLPQNYSSHVPLLMRYPDQLTAGMESDLLVGTMDLMPTMLGLMNMDVPSSVQGRNLAKAIINNNDDAVNSIPTFMISPAVPQLGVNEPVSWRGVVTQDYIFSYQQEGDHPLQNVLYDRKRDPANEHNLFNDKKYAEIRKKMKNVTREWMKKFEDPFVRAAELNNSGLLWHYPVNKNQAINRISPVEWLRSNNRVPEN